MPVSQNYIEYALDQLSLARPVTAKRMFGGVGLYLNGVFFGLIADDTLYFKVDGSNKEGYEDAGMPPFKPFGEGSYSMSFYQVPSEVIEDPDNLKEWAEEAIAAAANSKKPTINKTAPKKKESQKKAAPAKGVKPAKKA
jgi:DNA transformation protein and related proteins